jgi:hypothetical protein
MVTPRRPDVTAHSCWPDTGAAWRWAIAMGSGVLFVALGLSGIGNEAAVAFRAGDLDPQIARLCLRSGSGGIRQRPGSPWQASPFAAAGSSRHPIPAPLDGMAGHRKRSGLALSRISWTSYIWLLPYLMFWLWVIAVAVLLLRRNFRGVARSG